MAAKERPGRKKPTEKPREESKTAMEEAKAEVGDAVTGTKDEGKAETVLPETGQAIRATAENTEAPSRAPGEQEGEQRISFIVRLTVDERGQPRRTEVEHAQSGKKESFPTLDLHRLATFIEGTIKPPVTPEPIPAPAPSPVTPQTLTPAPLGPPAGVTVSEVHVFRTGPLGVPALVLNPDEASVVRVCFRLQGPETPSLTAQGCSFEMRVYARELTSGRSKLLIAHSDNLVQNVLEYTLHGSSQGLPPGLYRLTTLVTLHAATKMVGYLDGPIVHVSGLQPSADPAAPLSISLSQ